MTFALCSAMKSFGVDSMPRKMCVQSEEGMLRNLKLFLITHDTFRKYHTNLGMIVLCFIYFIS